MLSSCTPSAIVKSTGLHLLALSYNVNTVVLYFNSANNFPQHMGFIDERLTSVRENWEYFPLGAALLFDGVLFITNQSAFPRRLANLFNADLESCASSSGDGQVKHKIASGMSAFFKAVITSSSFLALLNQFIGLKWGVTATAILLPGNFASQFSILFEPFLKKEKLFLPHRLKSYIANYGSLSYAAGNAALYFNAADLAPSEFGLLSGRIIAERTPLGYGLLAINTALSLQFFYATHCSFSTRIHRLFESQEKGEETSLLADESQTPMTFKDRCTARASIASFWKAVVTSISMVVLFGMYNQSDVGIALAIAMFVGNYLSQLTLYAPDSREAVKHKQGSFFCCGRSDEESPETVSVSSPHHV